VDTAALPGGAENLGRGGLQPLVGVGNDPQWPEIGSAFLV
jgi:hypothetical protein